ncbi:hypothetical protein [Comamonas sp.]|uniref:LexA family protein n=1 Tax=Comamonas sp. TaxID=34028 RepID=UPI0028A00744|nr:hypothetical protein [Comamonas sp.]
MTTQNQYADLTTRQREVLDYMRAFLAENDQMPPLQLIADHFGYRAAAGAQFQVLALKRKGYLEANATGKVRFVRGRVTAATEESK